MNQHADERMNRSTAAGPLRFTDPAAVQKAWSAARLYYPSFIGEWIGIIDGYQTPAEKCTFGFRGFFESLNRFVGIICASIYLKDSIDDGASFEDVVRIQQQFRKLADPTTGSWVYLVIHILTYYRHASNRFFKIPELLHDSKYIVSNPLGYSMIYQDTIDFPQPPMLADGTVVAKKSVLLSGVEVRNAIHHDEIRTTNPFAAVFSFYQDILLRTLESYKFLNGRKYQFIGVNPVTLELEILHGKTPVIRKLAADHPLLSESSTLFLYNRDTDDYLPLYPGLVTVPDMWQYQKEYILESLDLNRKKLRYVGRNKDRFSDNETLYDVFRTSLNQKDTALKRAEFTSPNQFRERSLFFSTTTLETNYLNTRYFPASYLVRKSLQVHYEAFMADDTKTALLVWGEGGTGKSAWLCHIVRQLLVDPEADTVPLFLYAADFKGEEGDFGTYITLAIRRFFYLTDESIGSIVDFFEKIAGLRRKNPASMPAKILVVIDALNEANNKTETFEALNAIIVQASAYPWLKFIFSTRPFSFQYQSEFSNHHPVLAKAIQTYYAPTGKTWEGLRPQLPFVQLEPYNESEIRQVFTLMVASGRYQHLKSMESTDVWLKQDITTLAQPLILNFYVDLLNRRVGQHSQSAPEPEFILSEYFEEIVQPIDRQESLIRQCIHDLCRQLIEHNAPYLFSLQDLRQKYDVMGQRLGVIYFQNPVEILERLNIVQEKNIANQPVVQFTYQKFAEYALYRYLQGNDSTPSLAKLTQYLNKSAQFEDYNQALVLYAHPIWETGDYLALGQLQVSVNSERYTAILVDLLFSDWMSRPFLGRRSLREKQYENWCKKFRQFVGDVSIRLQHPLLEKFLYEKAILVLRDQTDAQNAYEFTLSSLLTLHKQQPLSRLTASMTLTYADRLFKTGNYQAVQELLAPLHDWLLEQIDRSPTEFAYQELLLDVHIRLGEVYLNQFQDSAAAVQFERSRVIAEQMSEATEMASVLLTRVYGRLGDLFYAQYEYEAAKAYYLLKLNTLEQASDLDSHLDRVSTRHKLATIYGADELLKEAITERERALELMGQAPVGKRQIVSIRQLRAELLIDQAHSYLRILRQLDVVHQFLMEGIEIAETLTADDPTNEEVIIILIKGYWAIADYHRHIHQYETAIDYLYRARKLLDTRLTENERQPLRLFYQANTAIRLGGIMQFRGVIEEATVFFSVAQDLLTELSQPANQSERIQRGLVALYKEIAINRWKRGKTTYSFETYLDRRHKLLAILYQRHPSDRGLKLELADNLSTMTRVMWIDNSFVAETIISSIFPPGYIRFTVDLINKRLVQSIELKKLLLKEGDSSNSLLNSLANDQVRLGESVTMYRNFFRKYPEKYLASFRLLEASVALHRQVLDQASEYCLQAWKEDLAYSLHALARACGAMDQLDASLDHFMEAFRLTDQLLKENPNNEIALKIMGDIYDGLGASYLRLGLTEKSILGWFRSAVYYRSLLYNITPESETRQYAVFNAILNLWMHLLAFGRFDEMAIFIDQSIKWFEDHQTRLNADENVKRTNEQLIKILKKRIRALRFSKKLAPWLIKFINFRNRLRYPAKSAKPDIKDL